MKGQAPQLLVLNEGMTTEQDYASHAVWVEGLIICNDGKGVVRLVTGSSVTVVEGRRWTAKDLVYEAAEDIMHVVPAADTKVVHRLLEFSHHQISSKRIGATLLYAINENPGPSRRHDGGIAVDALGFSILEDRDEPLLLHQARYRDGALLIGRNGRLLAVNVIMRPTRASEAAVPAMKGTRHTSSARHTYDCPDTLAFVVSTDGPVTVFSDGQRIADLKAADPQPPPKTAARIEELIALRRG